MVQRKESAAVNPLGAITRTIVVVRCHRVILDSALAGIYGVTTGRLNEAVKRNRARFPEDFMFQLTDAEHANLISQFAISKQGRGGRRKLPWAFTEHGAIQASNVLNSALAVIMGVYVVRAFVRLRILLGSNIDLAKRVDALEARIQKRLGMHDQDIASIISTIRELMAGPPSKRRGIGFTADLSD
jgi:hypothetical protein